MELRSGAPDAVRVGLLFVVEPQDTAVLVAWVKDPGRSPDQYQEVIQLARARLAMAQSDRPSADAASPAPSLPMTRNRFLTRPSPVQKPRSKSGQPRSSPAIAPTHSRKPAAQFVDASRTE